MSTHRREVRPRYGRIAALAASVIVTVVSALAGFGVLAGTADAGAAAGTAAYTSSPPTVDPTPSSASAGDATGEARGETRGETTPTTTMATTAQESSGSAVSPAEAAVAVPADSGRGRRIVFDQGLQRVWLVGGDGSTLRSYLVSGSLTDNLQPGTYSVYSKSRFATGIDDSGVMQYFVSFTQGPTGAAIGFHTIPTKNGVPLQTKAQLGTPQSHGCIRQRTPDAIALWHFAPIGTKVVVVA